MKTNKNKKSNISFDKIVNFTIVLIVIVVVIVLVIRYIHSFPVTSCEKDHNGVCYKTKDICYQKKGYDYTPVKGFGCPSNAPYCCVPNDLS
ncbi:MAG: hypothetical protein GWP09_01235 [Nitrospiraceae bacterium]|nr:hypothetical protein [Nitrospiraceae bacterium]